jgi:uncharacterized protein with HEPN domain
MSDADQPPREWRFYIADMIEFAEKVLAYTKDVDQDTLVADPLRYDAVLRNLELIGEAATHIPGHVRAAHPDIPWRAIVGLRNRLAHGYLTISDRVVWTTIQEAVPPLVPSLRSVLNAATDDRA